MRKIDRQWIKNLGIEALNPMQERMVKTSHEQPRVILQAPTGSGKTVAFLLPLLCRIDPEVEATQAMIVAPSRELAIQIEQVLRRMQAGVSTTCCYGGHAMRIERNNLSGNPAVIVGTPGRLADHLRRGHLNLQALYTVVLDEFDKSLELGFKKEMEELLAPMSRAKCRILTSATQGIEIPAFAGMKEAVTLDFAAPDDEPVRLAQYTVQAEGRDKLDALYRLICTFNNEAALVFCNHRDAVDRISEILARLGIDHGTFHGGMEQDERERALIRFRNGTHQLLVTTDLASRGLDIPVLKHVVHYQLPVTADVLVHRNGRTARMHATGKAWFLLAEGDYLPDYVTGATEEFLLPEETLLPERSYWQTLYFGAGRKDKIRKMDIAGVLMKAGGLNKEEVGVIELLDHAAFAAVPQQKVQKLIALLRDEKIKKRKMKVAISR